MLIAAREALTELTRPPLLVAVTLLTSMDETDLRSIGLDGAPRDHVIRLATLAHDCGLDGVVCSSRETQELRTRLGKDFRLVTPGIRPFGSRIDDQRRVMTPVDAIRNGSTYLVIGRPITQADDPLGILLTINKELAALN